MGYTFWIDHTRSARDRVMPSIAKRFNRALGGRPLFQMIWEHNDRVRIWIDEANIDALLANPNKNKLAGILASYAGIKAEDVASGSNKGIGGFVNRLTARPPRER